MADPKTFEGVRVIDLSSYIAAPCCGRLLADMGAEVIKVEPVKGEFWRPYGKIAWNVPADDEENPVFDIFNANKKSIPLNLKDPEGMKIMHKLLESADVFLTNTRPQSLKKMGLDYDSLKEKYPKLIVANILGYGTKGPDKDAAGYDTIAFWSRSGFVADQSVEGFYPVVMPGGFGDCATGTTLFGGICAALYNRTKTGKGDNVDVSLYGTATWFAGYTSVIAQPGYDTKYPAGRYEGNPAQYQYKTSDGEWLCIAVVDFARDFAKFAQIIGKPEWINDERYNSRPAMNKIRGEVIKTLEDIFIRHPVDYWDKKLTEADITHARLRHYKETLKDPQALENNYSFLHHYPNGSDKYLFNIPIHLENEGVKDFHRAPLLGEHTDEILSELGYTSEEIQNLKDSGATK
ncbi:MAG: CoA transferase [Lachnospiraceae bacterium]|nr:CoA transferase [Lachnospiraceae bacterium]